MLGCTAGIPAFEDFSMGYPEEDSSVQAVIGLFGVYDLLACSKFTDAAPPMPSGYKMPNFADLFAGVNCREHPELELFTPDGDYRLVIWAFLNQPSDSNIYVTNINDSGAQSEYIGLAENLADYVTSVSVAPGDRLVLLSTCAYEYDEARYIAVCKMVPWE